MKKYLAVILSYSMLIAASAEAQETVQSRVQALQEVPTVPAIPPGEDRIEPVSEGARAPFSGMLLSTDTAIRWTNALRWWPETFRLRAELLGQIHEMTTQSYESRLRLAEESYGREIEGLRGDLRDMAQRAADAETQPWYDTVGFGFAMGVILVLLIGGVSVGVAVGVM